MKIYWMIVNFLEYGITRSVKGIAITIETVIVEIFTNMNNYSNHFFMFLNIYKIIREVPFIIKSL